MLLQIVASKFFTDDLNWYCR